MTDPPYDVLFLCTGNSARSLLAECALARHGAGRFRAHSAGSRPTGAPHPVTIRVLQELGFETAGLRSQELGRVRGAWRARARRRAHRL